MLVFTLLVCFIWNQLQANVYGVLILTRNGYCITNDSSAIAFKVDREQETKSTYFPHNDDSEINCDFDSTSECTSRDFWVKGTSWNATDGKGSVFSPIITDKRWEGLEVIYTNTYTNTIRPISNAEQFEVALSIRIKQNANIYLCENYSLTTNCYWIFLDIEGTIGAQKCYPGKLCIDDKKIRTSNMLSENSWSHWLIKKKFNKIEVFNDFRKLFEYKDEGKKSFAPKYLILNSKNAVASWKIHETGYLYGTETTTNRLGPDIQVKNNTLCISMFVALCETCFLKIIFKNEQKDDVYSVEYKYRDDTWDELKILESISDKVVRMFIYSGNDGNSKSFWALDNIRECYKNEFRYLETTENRESCENVFGNKEEVSLTNNKPLTDLNCPENTFGTLCIPCDIMGEPVCSGIKYCETATGCRCTAGYKGTDCQEECTNSYGHDCSKQCSEQCVRCNNINGHCESCNCQFKGDRCEKSPEPLFKYAPNVTEVGTNYCKVTIDNFDIPGTWNHLKNFKVEFSSNEGRSWSNSRQFDLYEKSQYKITKLKPETTVLIRLKINYNDQIKNYSCRKNTSCTTTCIGIRSDDITVKATNMSAIFSIKEDNERCNLQNYKYNISEIAYEEPLNLSNFIAPLQPNTIYTINIIHPKESVKKSFRTLEGVLPKVDITCTNSTDTTTHLCWTRPNERDGVLQYYTVTYRIRRRNMCYSEELDSKENSMKSYKENVTIRSLQPYSIYSYEIRAHTKAGASEATTYYFTTQEGSFSAEENIRFRYNQTVCANNSITLNIYFDYIQCNHFNGHIFVKIVANCTETWCKNSELTVSMNQTSSNQLLFLLPNLFPFSKYDLTVQRSRNAYSDWELVKSEKFKTTSSAPNSIDSLEVTSKDNNHISFRWTAPFPPTGEIEHFYMNYTCCREYSTKIFQTDEKCLWPHYYCGDIDIQSCNYCKLQLYAKNKGYEFSSKITYEILVDTIMEASMPPEDVRYLWDDNNDLRVYWVHPNKTNGKLKQFQINFLNSVFYYNINSTDDYKLNYSYLISTSDLAINWCTTDEIGISANNKGNIPSQLSRAILYMPPNIPDETFNEISSTNSTITIKITEGKPKHVMQEHFVLVSEKYSDSAVKNLIEYVRKGHDVSTVEGLRCRISNQPLNFEIGNPEKICYQYVNPPLKHGRNYSITVVFKNSCNKQTYVRITNITKFLCTKGIDGKNICISQQDGSSNSGLFALILLLIIPCIVYGYWYLKKNNYFKGTSGEEVPLATVKPRAKIKPIRNKNTHLKPLPPLVTVHSKRVRITNLEEYIKGAIQNGELEKQHNIFPRGMIKPHEYASLEQNMPKNRYKNLMAYDHTRVKLKEIADDKYSDYINANYIDGYKIARAYIATQGPKPNTLNDFWRMIWQENIQHIVMLANIIENGKKKVEKYWPDINEEKSFGNVRVKFQSAEVFANFEYRTFNVYHGKTERKLHQLHFTSWPDHGVPMYAESMVVFLQRMLKIPYKSSSPILVHCSAGVGRTGTIILSDICLRMAAGEGYVDFLAHLEHIRNQRPNLVDNVDQYKLAHLVVLECLFGFRSSVPCNEDMEKLVQVTLDNNGVKNEMKYIDEVMWQDNAMQVMFDEDIGSKYSEKNRFSSILPGNYRIFISCYPRTDSSSSYINAVQVDGFKIPGRYIVTQQPMPNTLGDFWRMVVEHQCSVIVSLNEINSKDPAICQFWPEKNCSLVPVKFIKIQNVKEEHFKTHNIITVRVENKSNEVSYFDVNILNMKNWKPNDILPGDVNEFLTFVDSADTLSRNVEPIIVTCYDGATACGLFIAMAFIIDKMNLEHECDVCQAVRNIRHFRKQFVTDEVQYKFLYKTAVRYINSYRTYSNFS